jgi:hypothetical protein
MTKPKSATTNRGAREARLAQALKDNLQRRKAQARKRISAAESAPRKPRSPKSA